MTDPTIPEFDEPIIARRDKYLSTFVAGVDSSVDPVDKDQFPVTLMVPGGIITGSLVPQWQYARNLIPASVSGGPAPFERYAEGPADYARRAQAFRGREIDAEPTDEERNFMAEEVPSEIFLTLGWARFLLANTPGPAEAWIRVRRDDVIAWHYGSLSVSLDES